MKTSPVLCCCWYLFAPSLSAEDDNKMRLMTFLCGDTTEFRFELSRSQAARLPNWNPESSKPAPVSTSRACAVAKQALKKRHPALDEFEVFAITLRHVEWNKLYDAHSLDTWFYVVECRAKRDGK